MLSLAHSQIQGALDALHAIGEGCVKRKDFARRGVECLPRLVASELTTLSVCNLDDGRRSVVSDKPGALGAREVALFDRHFHEHPLVREHGRNRRAVTRRIEDLVPQVEFRESGLYNDYYRAIRIDRAMAVPIHVHRHVLVSFVLNRSGRDFSERDREVLESIRPHLGNLYRLTRGAEGPRAAWGVPSPDGGTPRAAALTARECEVLDWLGAGKTDRDIADILAISHRTVHKHLQRIYEKLGVENRTAAVARAFLRG